MEVTSNKELAVMTGVTFGMSRDYGTVVLRFDVHMGSGYSSTLCLNTEEAIQLIKDADVADVYKLERMVCYVTADSKGGICRYAGMFKY